jgi:hypothetical protein
VTIPAWTLLLLAFLLGAVLAGAIVMIGVIVASAAAQLKRP